MIEVFSYIVITLFGLCLGSFLNVCIYRLPRKKSIIRPHSFCPHCHKLINWFDNIPVISFIILKGRCRHCHAKISLRYLVVEVVTAFVLCLNLFFFGFGFSFLIWSLFATSLIVISFIDLEFQLIPDIITLGGILLGLIVSLIYPKFMPSLGKESAFLNSLLGVLVGGGGIYFLGLLGRLTFRRESMGFGDVKLLAMIGSFLGWRMVILCFFIAPVLGSFWGLFLKIKYKKDIMPYGPFLSLAGLICLYWGKNILDYFFIFTNF